VSNAPSASVPPRREVSALVLMLVSLALYTFADLGSKEWALDNLSRARVGSAPPTCQPDDQGYVRMQRVPNNTVVLIDDYLEFRYAENCGAAFGMLRTAPSWVRAVVFGVAGLGACVVLSLMFMRGSGGRLFALSVPLVLSGAIGNLADRVRHGFVVDFIRFHIHNNWEYPTFNVADVTIAIGVGLLLIDGLKKPAAGQGEVLASEPSSADRS
jgi:signal peptidase II